MKQKNVLKGSRRLALEIHENLKEKTDEKARLEQAFVLNAPLATSYYLKEEFR